ncbi:MAG: 4-hydroxy-3-methylbut-2-enyl diphosphate reductase [Candidatus Omnitrophica bacterium]|nr:4-hydroxy-3-methylbut-2-enyl diphosphate reductase [Candidatus Omnitrophota bacterium]HQP12130.1 4-hydroxy-3-methylbut-2-enyl diphosphate reductase [Candidatus Omnitrophota bacterium]
MNIYLARTQGFCAGVSFATAVVERALQEYGLPIYVYHEIVHNTFVVNAFKERGIVFVEKLSEVPPGSRVIFSAHGVPPAIVRESGRLRLRVIDATCPLVKKVHRQATKYSDSGYHTVLIGHKGHQEIIGTSGYIKEDLRHIVETVDDVENLAIPPESKVGYITQTTLSVDESKLIIEAMHRRFPNLEDPARDDICYATQTRQDAVKELASLCEIIIICGSANSSNSNRLRETGERCGVPSHIIDSAADLKPEWFRGVENIGVSSGASVPHFIVEALVQEIENRFPGADVIRFENPERNIVFPLPDLL